MSCQFFTLLKTGFGIASLITPFSITDVIISVMAMCCDFCAVRKEFVFRRAQCFRGLTGLGICDGLNTTFLYHNILVFCAAVSKVQRHTFTTLLCLPNQSAIVPLKVATAVMIGQFSTGSYCRSGRHRRCSGNSSESVLAAEKWSSWRT